MRPAGHGAPCIPGQYSSFGSRAARLKDGATDFLGPPFPNPAFGARRPPDKLTSPAHRSFGVTEQWGKYDATEHPELDQAQEPYRATECVVGTYIQS